MRNLLFCKKGNTVKLDNLFHYTVGVYYIDSCFRAFRQDYYCSLLTVHLRMLQYYLEEPIIPITNKESRCKISHIIIQFYLNYTAFTFCIFYYTILDLLLKMQSLKFIFKHVLVVITVATLAIRTPIC